MLLQILGELVDRLNELDALQLVLGRTDETVQLGDQHGQWNGRGHDGQGADDEKLAREGQAVHQRDRGKEEGAHHVRLAKVAGKCTPTGTRDRNFNARSARINEVTAPRRAACSSQRRP